MLKFRCGSCKQKIGVPDEYVGKRVRCPRCKEATTVPHASEIAPEMPQADMGAGPPQPTALPASVEVQPMVDAQPVAHPPAAPPVPDPIVAPRPPAPDLAAVFAQYMPVGVNPLQASMDDLWEDRLPVGADRPIAADSAVEQSEPLNLSQTMEVEVPRPLTAEVIEPPLRADVRRARSSDEEVNDLLRDLGEVDLPPEAPPPPYPPDTFDEFDEQIGSSAAVPEPSEPAPAPSKPADVPRRPAGIQAAIFGIAGILLGLGALALCGFSGAARFAIPVATAGLLLALAGVVMVALRNAQGIALPSTGTIIATIGIAVPVLGAYGVVPLPGHVRVPVAGSTPVVNISLPASEAFAVQAAQRIPVDGFVPATSPVIAGLVEIRVSSVRVVQPVVHDGHWNSIHSLADKRLVISLELKNIAPGGRVSYHTWAQSLAGEQPTLIDGAGKLLKQIDTAPAVPLGRVSENPAGLYAGRSAVPDVLIYEQPADTSQDLKLELPGAHIALPDTVLRIRIPAQMIQH